jgi:hypothetical protein
VAEQPQRYREIDAGERVQMRFAAQQRNDQIGETRLGIRASTQELQIGLRPDKSLGTLTALEEETGIYNRGRFQALSLHNAGKDTLIPNVVKNTPTQLNVFSRQLVNRLTPVEGNLFRTDFTGQGSSGDIGAVLADIQKKKNKLGKNPLDFADLGGTDQGDPNSAGDSAAALAGIEKNMLKLDKTNELLAQLVAKLIGQ